jgi:hypothetical protein
VHHISTWSRASDGSHLRLVIVHGWTGAVCIPFNISMWMITNSLHASKDSSTTPLYDTILIYSSYPPAYLPVSGRPADDGQERWIPVRELHKHVFGSRGGTLRFQTINSITDSLLRRENVQFYSILFESNQNFVMLVSCGVIEGQV